MSFYKNDILCNQITKLLTAMKTVFSSDDACNEYNKELKDFALNNNDISLEQWEKFMLDKNITFCSQSIVNLLEAYKGNYIWRKHKINSYQDVLIFKMHSALNEFAFGSDDFIAAFWLLKVIESDKELNKDKVVKFSDTKHFLSTKHFEYQKIISEMFIDKRSWEIAVETIEKEKK